MPTYYTYYKSKPDYAKSEDAVHIEDGLSVLRKQIEDSIAFQNRYNRRKAKVVKSCKNTFRAKKWR